MRTNLLDRYGGDNRYELIDEEVFDLEPTGSHEEVAAFITTKICVQIDLTGLPWIGLIDLNRYLFF